MNDCVFARFVVFLALVAAVAGCGNPTADKPAAEVSGPIEVDQGESGLGPGEADSEVALGQQAGTVYTLTANSGIDFEGYKVTGPHVGGFGRFEGSVTIPGEEAEQARIRIAIDMTSIYSDDPALTTRLKSADFFDVEVYPAAMFTSTGIVKTAEGYNVTGNLELHGVTRGITFPAAISLDGDTLSAEAEFTINRFDWDITYKGMADDLIRDDVLIFFEVEAKADAGD